MRKQNAHLFGCMQSFSTPDLFSFAHDRRREELWGTLNLVPRAHVPFGQHQDTELWNNQFPETKILGLPASQRMRGLVYMASREKVDVDK